MGIKRRALEVKVKWFDHYTTEAPLDGEKNIMSAIKHLTKLKKMRVIKHLIKAKRMRAIKHLINAKRMRTIKR